MTVHIYIYLNNTTIVNCLDAMGGTHVIECSSAAKDIWQFCIEREIWISAALIPGKNNTQADSESRVFIDNKGGIANARHTSTSYKNLFEPPFDRFVPKLNAQVSCYASWRPVPGASYVDVFSITWETIFLCFSLI